jgi:hypothetical protein
VIRARRRRGCKKVIGARRRVEEVRTKRGGGSEVDLRKEAARDSDRRGSSEVRTKQGEIQAKESEITFLGCSRNGSHQRPCVYHQGAYTSW